MEALPESRMIFLVRDPRDVVASAMDANRAGGWARQRVKDPQREAKLLMEGDLDTYIAERAKRYMLHVGNSRDAYNAHRGPKVMVRYEDLRTDTLGEMRRIYSTLGMPADEKTLARVVEKRSWENIPEKRKGEGKFTRKAKPGGWSEDLTTEQSQIVEKITAPLLKEFYSD